MSKDGELVKEKIHNPKDFKMRWSVAVIPIIFYIFVLIFGIVNTDVFTSVLDKGVMFVMKDMGWFISLSTLFFVIFCFAVWLTSIGKIKLGGPNAKTEHGNFEYFALSLCAGMATGFVLWPVAEMIEYTANPAGASGIVAQSYESIVWALQNEFMHWGFTPYAIYTSYAIVVAYAIYNLRKPYAASSALYPLAGDRLNNRIITIVDAVCLFAIIGGVSGSLGYGLLQLGAGLEYLYGIETGLTSWIAIAIVITIIYTASSVSGLKKGIAWISDKNAWLFILFLGFAAIFGPKSFNFNLMAESFGGYVNNFIELITFQDFMPDGDLWPQWWGTIWWLDWIAFAPMTGLFITSISKGRTLREVVTFNMIIPALFAMLWFGVFAGSAAHAQYIMGEDLISVLEQSGHESMQLFALSYFPFEAITKPLMLTTQMISFITLANSMTSTISLMTIEPGKEYTSSEGPTTVKIFWGVLMAAIAILFLSTGGLDGAKSVKAITGFPVFIIQLAVVGGFIRFFVTDKAPEKNVHVSRYEYTNLDEETGELKEHLFK